MKWIIKQIYHVYRDYQWSIVDKTHSYFVYFDMINKIKRKEFDVILSFAWQSIYSFVDSFWYSWPKQMQENTFESCVKAFYPNNKYYILCGKRFSRHKSK
jgi:hypothetical protein